VHGMNRSINSYDFGGKNQQHPPHDQEQPFKSIQYWLVTRLAELLDANASAINVLEPFASYGLESVDVVGLSGELEEWLKRELPPTLLYDYPNIQSLAHYLAESPDEKGEGGEDGIRTDDGTEPIAIIGIGCRFPGAKDPQAFWQLLCNGVDAISEVPEERWHIDSFYNQDILQAGKMNTRWGGFLEQVDRFDAQFFGISPREAERMDPQQRLLLEVVWEALEDAGQPPADLAGTRTGVFIGIANSDYSRMQFHDPELSDAYAGTGSAYSIAANRISYLFDWHGPSMAIDTACSSSLVAVHLACQSLWKGEISLALAGGVSLILSPELTVNFTKAGFMAPDGRCKAFDARANGYVRGEGAGVVVLKPLAQALAEGDPVYAVIRGSAVNQDGRTNGLTAPNRQSQESVLLQAYAMAGLSPGQVQYVEAHGTGTSLGDPIEAMALGHVLASDRYPGNPCLLGSVKTNIGHLEAAAGIAGLIKVALALKYGMVPPSLHFIEPNPYITFDELPLRVQTALTPWPTSRYPALAGVSSFGFGGTNAHVVLEGIQQTLAESSEDDEPASKRPQPRLLPLSARSTESLKRLALAYRSFFNQQDTKDAIDLADICYTAGARRNHHDYRLTITACTHEEFSACLEMYLRGEEAPGIHSGRKDPHARPQLVFVFPGQGSQWIGMGRQLLEHEPIFAEALASCEEAMHPYVNWSLRSVLTSEEEASLLERIDVVQPALFAIQVALAALWRSRGIVPDAVVGHSMGEVAAAYVAGALSLADAARVICLRSKLLRRVSGKGAMALAELSLEQAEHVVARYADRLSVAVSNSPRSTVLSGEPLALEEVLRELEQRNIFCRRVKVDVASHNPQMDSLRDALMSELNGLRPHLATIPMHSTVTGMLCTGQELDATYWVRNLRDPVRFATVLQQLATEGYTLYLELSPHPILLPAIQECLQYSHREGQALPSMRRAEEEQAVLVESLGALYAHGYPVDWHKLHPADGHIVSLPAYPWQRERFWLEPARGTQGSRNFLRRGAPVHPFLGGHLESSIQAGVHYWEYELSLAALPYLNDHRVLGQAVIPAAVYLEMVLEAKEVLGAGPHIVEEVTFSKMLALAEGAEQTVQVALSDDIPGRVAFRISSRLAQSNKEGTKVGAKGTEARENWTLCASGTIRLVTDITADSVIKGTGPRIQDHQTGALGEIQERCTEVIAGATYYEMLSGQGLEYGPGFQAIGQIWRRKGEAIARLDLPEEVRHQSPLYHIHPVLLDACFQAVGATISQATDEAVWLARERSTYLPVGLDSLRVNTSLSEVTDTIWSHVLLQSEETSTSPIASGTRRNSPTWTANLELLDAQGQVLMEVQGLHIQQLAIQSNKPRQEMLDNWLYQIGWHPQPRQEIEMLEAGYVGVENPERATRAANWLIFADYGSTSPQLKARLQAHGESCIMIFPGEMYERMDGEHYRINPARLPDFLQLLEEAFNAAGSSHCAGIIHLWSLESASTEETTPATLERAQQLGCGSALHLVQALSLTGWRDLPRLWLVTQGSQTIVPTDTAISVAQSPLWGLGRTITHEHPRLQPTLVDLSPSAASPEEIQALVEELLGSSQEDQLALRGRARYVARLDRYIPATLTGRIERKVHAEDQPFRLEIEHPGILDHLTLRAATRRIPGPGEVEIEVAAASLNFLDILKVLGIAPVQEPGAVVPGSECAGRVTALGKDVVDFAIGDEVIALADGCIGTHTTTPAYCVIAKPANLSFEQAAAIPIVFLTTYYALHTLARIGRGERVLIHSAAGGTGLAAVQVAQLLGAEIFATAGSQEKREYLRSLGIQHVMDSRSLAFAGEVLATTQGRGIDVVLNSLVGSAMAKSLSILSPYGRFIELGKKDIYQNNLLELSPFRRNLSYFALDLAGMVRERPESVRALLQEVMQFFKQGLLKPPPMSVYSIDRAAEAFHTMAQAKHIGKLVISLQDRSETLIIPTTSASGPIRADATYLITGGLGGIGLKVAQWLIEQGARHLVLLGRSSVPQDVEEHLTSLRGTANVRVARVDVTQPGQVASLLREIECAMPPLRGIMHAAGILDDGLLLNLDKERFQRVLEPKVTGAWNLHTLTQSAPLDFFVLFSSAASLLGSPGQGNYAAANAFLDALAQHRRNLNLPALSINWGAWDTVGLASTQANRGKRLALMGMANLSPVQGIEALDFLLQQQETQVGVIPLNLRQWRQSYPQAAQAPFLAHLAEEQGPVHASRSASAIGIALLTADVDKQRALLEDYLRQQIARALRLPLSRVDASTDLNSLGFDSLMALELRNRLEDDLDVTLPATMAWRYPTITTLAEYVAEKMGIALKTSISQPEDMEKVQFSQQEEEHIVKALEMLRELSSKELG
jgi:phthiocerol/phenolphthiocerol synthesis type-I polyketide synthase C